MNRVIFIMNKRFMSWGKTKCYRCNIAFKEGDAVFSKKNTSAGGYASKRYHLKCAREVNLVE